MLDALSRNGKIARHQLTPFVLSLVEGLLRGFQHSVSFHKNPTDVLADALLDSIGRS